MLKKKNISTGRAIGILFAHLVLWWIFLTLFSYSINLNDGDLLYYIVNFLRISVPIMTLIFGAPIILIVGYDKRNNLKKNKSNTK